MHNVSRILKMAAFSMFTLKCEWLVYMREGLPALSNWHGAPYEWNKLDEL